MKPVRTLLILNILMWNLSCQNKGDHPDGNQQTGSSIFERVQDVPDSIRIDGVAVYNLFKYQILAHREGAIDSPMIIDRVYRAQPKIWNELYGILFDSAMFGTHEGMVKWNGEIFYEKRDSIESRVNRLLDIRFDSILEASLIGVKQLTGRTPQNVRLSVILAPVEGIGFGGITNDAFVLDLLDNNYDVVNLIREGMPHEFNHFIYDATRKDDPDKDTPLRLVIDEGLACFYAHRYFEGRISEAQAVEQMTDDEWNWYMLHEKDVFDKCSPYFYYQGDGDPLRKLGDELGAPKTLFYWLGFRIVEFYVKGRDPDSWNDIYDLPVKEVLEKSGYEEYIRGLK